MEISPRLTTKQQSFVACINSGMNGTQAAKVSYRVANDNTAAVIAYENLRKPQIVSAINNSVNEYTLRHQTIQELSRQLKATKYYSSAKVYVPDHAVRMRAIKMTLRLMGIRY